jgi:hypothetical protein
MVLDDGDDQWCEDGRMKSKEGERQVVVEKNFVRRG